MKISWLRKLLVVAIILAPVFSYEGCKKQAKCGCDGDVLFTLTDMQAYVYFNETGSSIYVTPVDNPYSTYYFCNPSEMFSKLKNQTSGDVMLVSGDAFWDCNYIYQSSNYSYATYYKYYQLHVTDVRIDMYGKK